MGLCKLIVGVIHKISIRLGVFQLLKLHHSILITDALGFHGLNFLILEFVKLAP